MVRKEALNDDFARAIAAARAARHLRQQLKRSLRGAKVRQRQRGIRRENSDQRHEREVVSLGDHLRSDQNVDLALSKTAKHALEVANVLHGVAVDASDARIREQFPQVGLDTLGALADIMDVFALAFRAPRRGALRQPAVVAQQLVDRPVIGHRDAAGGALKRKPAVAAEQETPRIPGGSAAPSSARAAPAVRRSPAAGAARRPPVCLRPRTLRAC